ncbi:MarR family winged helix-turn-helix transcriptional regulator [Actinomycetospora termitidis]|uniref:MarR family winged helix-turn-helix transcriptional regulator n=1 Tax=Actinomycetospora termitidis TaxID=3053470 RepID=A0ABT7MBZ8_9PSEU|nr:MarR family winged helix-turn-helix transcriptional regulator [Actinomycetospora sp. Odt1-22]MDL5157694.1 MarR family winged helix-turn-helix transcriptional regulator [Actinomycetospora sp. Odt1-22]
MNAPIGERPAPPVPEGADERWRTSDRIGLQLIRLIRHIERKRMTKPKDDGVERAAYVLLARLVISGPHRSNALAEAVHSDPSTVSRQVAALVRIGYVERRPDPADGRACLLAATAEGHRVFEANRDLRNRWISDVTSDWDEADRERLVALMDRFTTALENHHDASQEDR